MRKLIIPGLLMIFNMMMMESSMSQKDSAFRFDSVKGDPLKARIYTLDNGLRVYLTVYRDAPRIQTYIAVHTGSKMDPPETTGLAHYFEHMMFKGTQHFGTTDWAAERPLINEIENLFEQYRKEKNEQKRVEIYHRIDSLSYAASKLAIPNEYDKLMDAIGSQGSNAGTSSDYTIFQENIPSNEIENWSAIESDRFTDPVLRIFHTELETVYEEKNMSLTNDNRKVSEAMMKALFPNHPYGTQTTLGETEHLKNPSMKNIREFFDKYYVPNNMAICMSGDFDPDQVIRIIAKYFGNLKSSPVPPLIYSPWQEPANPVTKEITGLEAESVRIGFGFDMKANDDRSLLLVMVASILSNGKAGLIDLNINQKQKALTASAYDNQMADYGMLVLSGRPKTGQTAEEVKDLLLEQIDKLRKGDFPDWMLEAAVNNAKLSLLKQYETNQGRAMTMANNFLNDIPWQNNVNYLEKLGRIRKQDIIDFASGTMKNNYAVIYKRQGQPEDVVKIKKPPITPIYVNRESESDFVKKIRGTPVKAIEPVFIDYAKDLETIDLPGKIRLIFKENKENATFNFVYYYKIGRNNDKVLHFAVSYLPFLGTSKHTAEEIRQEFYRLGCSFNASCSEEETTLTLNGLADNFEKAYALMEELLTDPWPDKTALDNLVANTLKSRNDSKSNQNEVFNALVSYGTFGPKSSFTNILITNELNNLTPDVLVDKIRELNNYRHQVLYYGPGKTENLVALISRYNIISPSLNPDPVIIFPELATDSNRVLFAHYNARQSRIESIVKEGKYDKGMAPQISMYNNYFGSNIVFQELREKRALAYTAYSRFQEPNDPEKSYLSIGYIATQNDKIIEALAAFNQLFDAMPASDITYNVSKNSVLNRIRSERITRMNLIWNFLNAERLGLTYDIRKDIFEKVSGMTLNEVTAFNEKFIRGKTRTYVILGKESEMDFQALESFGPVTRLTLEELFGY